MMVLYEVIAITHSIYSFSRIIDFVAAGASLLNNCRKWNYKKKHKQANIVMEGILRKTWSGEKGLDVRV